MLNDILTLDQLQWLPYRSDFPSSFMTLIPGLTFTQLRFFSTEYMQRVWITSRERLPFRTPGSVSPFWDLFMLKLLRPVWPNLPYLFSTYRLEYPSVLYPFCSLKGGLFINFEMCVRLVIRLLRLMEMLRVHKPVKPHQWGDCCYSNWPS